MLRRALPTALLFVLAAPSATSGQTVATSKTATETADDVADYYKNTKQFTAPFTHTTESKTFGRKRTQKGTLRVKAPGKMRWDYASKKKSKTPGSVFMSDGVTLWAVFPKNNSFYQQPIGQTALPAAITFLAGTGNLKSSFRIGLDQSGTYGTSTDRVLELTPIAANVRFSTVWLVVDKTSRVRESIVKSSNGDISHYTFGVGDTSTTISNSSFVFNARKNKRYKRIKPPASGSASGKSKSKAKSNRATRSTND